MIDIDENFMSVLSQLLVNHENTKGLQNVGLIKQVINTANHVQ